MYGFFISVRKLYKSEEYIVLFKLQDVSSLSGSILSGSNSASASFTLYRIHFTSDCRSPSGMKFVCFDDIIFHIGLAACLHESASLCIAMVLLHAFCIQSSTVVPRLDNEVP